MHLYIGIEQNVGAPLNKSSSFLFMSHSKVTAPVLSTLQSKSPATADEPTFIASNGCHGDLLRYLFTPVS